MSGGSYTVRLSAADPEVNKGPLAPTYDKLTPAEYLAIHGSYPIGFATDPLANAESATPAGANDSVSSLASKYKLTEARILDFVIRDLACNGCKTTSLRSAVTQAR